MRMSNFEPVQSADLAVAWVKALTLLTRKGVGDVAPLVVNVSGFTDGFPSEAPEIRQEADALLDAARTKKETLCTIETTANLIFPENLWLRYRNDGRRVFFDRYRGLGDRLKKRDSRNRKGTYFSRMIKYGKDNLDQLSHVLDVWDGGTHRRSALQVVIFDPMVDHTRQPFLGFPCLDYITFTPNTAEGTLSIMALYADQWIVDRGYGNYLGLCRLGRFVAEQMKLRFAQLTCIASCAQLGDVVGKRETQDLLDRVQHLLRNAA
jgi:hypothetical protein